MAVISGFFNSSDSTIDRYYQDWTLYGVLDGAISDGVFKTINGPNGELKVSSDGSLYCFVAPGKIKYKTTWGYLDRIIGFLLEQNPSTYQRRDAIVYTVDHEKKECRIEVFQGKPSSVNEYPYIPPDTGLIQHVPLAYITIAPRGGITYILNMLGLNDEFLGYRLDYVHALSQGESEVTESKVIQYIRSDAHLIMKANYIPIFSGAVNSGSISLSQSISNFKRLDVFYYSTFDVQYHSSVSIPVVPGGMTGTMKTWFPVDAGGGVTHIYMVCGNINISDKTAYVTPTLRFYGEGRVPASGLQSNDITVERIVGYR